MLGRLVETISLVERKLMDKFWPGLLTIKFKKKAHILPDVVSAGDDYVLVIREGKIRREEIEAIAPIRELSL